MNISRLGNASNLCDLVNILRAERRVRKKSSLNFLSWKVISKERAMTFPKFSWELWCYDDRNLKKKCCMCQRSVHGL